MDQTLAAITMHNLLKPLTAREQKALDQADEYLSRELREGIKSESGRENETAPVLEDDSRQGE